MKRLFMLLGALVAVAAHSQTTSDSLDPLDAQIFRPPEQRLPIPDPLLIEKSAKPNQIVGENVAYSGIAVQLAKTDNPLQLINPAAPPKYGSSEDNVARDPINGKVTGLKIFAIDF